VSEIGDEGSEQVQCGLWAFVLRERRWWQRAPTVVLPMIEAKEKLQRQSDTFCDSIICAGKWGSEVI